MVTISYLLKDNLKTVFERKQQGVRHFESLGAVKNRTKFDLQSINKRIRTKRISLIKVCYICL